MSTEPKARILRFEICSGRRCLAVSAANPWRNLLEMRFLGSQLLFWSPSLAVVVDAIANSWPPRIPNIPWYLRSSPFLRFEVVQAGVRSQPCRFGA
jgi:hypothetical protein